MVLVIHRHSFDQTGWHSSGKMIMHLLLAIPGSDPQGGMQGLLLIFVDWNFTTRFLTLLKWIKLQNN